MVGETSGRCLLKCEWTAWPFEVHDDKGQVDRQGRALRYPFTILSFDEKAQTARFSSTSDLPYYDTTLDNCTCYDFQERKLPCKHIYRLAKEVGIIEIVSRPGGSKKGLYKPDHLNEILLMDDLHNHDDQRVRQRNARKCAMTSYDTETETAIFKGSGKKPYITTLESCTCQDFGMRKLPCKHMYRLMHEVGRFNLDAVPDGRVSEIKGIERDFDHSLLEGLSKEAQEELYCLLCRWISTLFGNEWLYERDEPISAELINKGLLEECETNILPIILSIQDYNDLRAVLRERGIKVKNKSEAYQKILSEAPDFIEAEKAKYRVLQFKEELMPDRAVIAKYIRMTVIYPDKPELHKTKMFWNELPEPQKYTPFNLQLLPDI